MTTRLRSNLGSACSSSAKAAKFDYLTKGQFGATISKIKVPGTVSLGDYATTVNFGTTILKFEILQNIFLTVTTRLRAYLERLYKNLRI